jgi:hypothetical protein
MSIEKLERKVIRLQGIIAQLKQFGEEDGHWIVVEPMIEELSELESDLIVELVHAKKDEVK